MKCHPSLLSGLPVLLCAGLLLPVAARAELIGHDGFDYRGTSMNGQEGGTFWGYRNIAPAGHKAGMSDWDDAPGFGGGPSVPSGGQLFTADSGVIREFSGPALADESNGAVNPATVAKKVYFRVTLTRGTGADWCGVSSFDFGTERLFFGLFPDGTGRFSIYNQNTFTRMALSTVSAAVGQTYTLVAKVDFTAGQVALYADPDISQSEASNTPIASAAYSGTHWSTAVRLGSGGNGLVSWDNLMVATTWESLRTYEVTHLNDGGAGSLRAMTGLARTTGGRITFAPALRSLYAVTGTGRLLRFKRESPGVLELNLPITGLQPDETVAAIDFRPATGELYALGNIPSLKVPVPTPQTRLYRLNLLTGAASMVGSGPFSTTIGDGGGIGFDFDPRVDRIRVTNEQGENVLVHPETGTIAVVQIPLSFANGSTDASGSNVRALQTAYSNNFPGSTVSTLYGFHNYTGGFFNIGGEGAAADPSGGAVHLLFPVTAGPRTTTGFDIGDDGTALVSGTPDDASYLDPKSTLYQFDPTSGKFSRLGLIGNGTEPVTGIAASPSRITLTSGPLTIAGGNAFVVDGPSTAPGIILATGGATALVEATDTASPAFRNLTFTAGRGSQGGAISIASPVASETLGLLSLDRCTFRGNHAATRGGALSIAQTNARLTHCTLSGNTSGSGGASAIYQQHGGTFGAETWGTIHFHHCTVSGNHTSSNSAGNPPQALVLPSAKTIFRNSIAAGNTNAAAQHPDAAFSTLITQPPVVERSLIGVGTVSGPADFTNGNRVGTIATPLLPQLAPLGDHGGTNYTSPPFPGSLAISLAAGSGATSDQRGFLINGAPDAGAADFRGRPDLLLWWETDWDQDGVRFGLENLLGRNPLAYNAVPPLEIRAAPSPGPTGTHMLYFGPALPPPSSLAYGRLRLMRSDILLAFYNEAGAIAPATPGNPATTLQFSTGPGYTWSSDGSASLRFTPFPGLPRQFYRLDAQLLP